MNGFDKSELVVKVGDYDLYDFDHLPYARLESHLVGVMVEYGVINSAGVFEAVLREEHSFRHYPELEGIWENGIWDLSKVYMLLIGGDDDEPIAVLADMDDDAGDDKPPGPTMGPWSTPEQRLAFSQRWLKTTVLIQAEQALINDIPF